MRAPDEIALWLGRFVQTFGNVEYLMQSIAWDLLGVDSVTGAAVTERILDRELCGLIERLAKRPEGGPRGITQEHRDEAVSLSKEVASALPRRDQLVHGFWWSSTPDFGDLQGQNIRGLAKMIQGANEPTPWDAPQIRKFHDEVQGLMIRAAKLHETLGNLRSDPGDPGT